MENALDSGDVDLAQSIYHEVRFSAIYYLDVFKCFSYLHFSYYGFLIGSKCLEVRCKRQKVRQK